jgi:hypothetical protein
MRTTIRHQSFIMILLLAFSSCKKDEVIEVTSDHEFTIELSERKEIKNGSKSFKFTYAELIEHSLCPKDAQCIWAGRVVIQLTDDTDTKYLVGIGDLKTIKDGVENQVLIQEFIFRLISYNDDGSLTLEVSKV